MFSKKTKRKKLSFEETYRQNLIAIGLDPDDPESIAEHFGETGVSAYDSAMSEFDKYIQKDLELYQAQESLEAIDINLNDITTQKVINCPDDRFLNVYVLLEEELRKSTKIDLRSFKEIKDLLNAVNELDDYICDAFEKITEVKELSDAEEVDLQIKAIEKDLRNAFIKLFASNN